MATDLGLDSELAAAEAVGDSATGWADRVLALLGGLTRSNSNPFGSAARIDTGNAAGNIPVITADGRLADAPLGRAAANGVASLDADGHIPDAQLRLGEADGVASLGSGGIIPGGQMGRAAANGVASLDADSRVPLSQLPIAVSPIYTREFSEVLNRAGTIEHTLGVAPNIVSAWLQCAAANNGFEVGDRVYFQPTGFGSDQAPHLWASDTLIGYNLSNFSADGATRLGGRGIFATNLWLFRVQAVLFQATGGA